MSAAYYTPLPEGHTRDVGPEARCHQQGTCPKPWVALVDGEYLKDGRGAWRRFSTREAAFKAARAAYTERT